ncbi:hypothetical protein HU200_050392 [Digitaria exilis]|uniref:Reverse transcriptase zinc-binding domain-containing protein n=1 Tax=Digitaria exilis TaxID=1010633 RepID=A0A835AUJ0_9POAL|nr:hypothetical protein HU200_050392 [Digitaria exilis]
MGLDDSYCELCPGILETDTHIFSGCPRAVQVWVILGANSHEDDCRRPWMVATPAGLPQSVHLDVILLLLWNLWKARNVVIFDQENTTPQNVLRQVVANMDSWRSRYKQQAQHWTTWRDFIQNSL